MKTAVICFFNAYPATSGSGRVCYDFFRSWPNPNKKLFQMSEVNNKKKNVVNIKLKENKPIFKILSLPKLIIFLIKYFLYSKKNVLIIEGPSWIFYSFILVFFFKLFYKNILVIYRSHSIELEIRKNNSNFFIVLITKLCEKFVYKFSDISTSVSQIERKKLFNYYRVNTHIFPNSIRIKDLISLKKNKVLNLPKKFIFFCGSNEYPPNKEAIDYLIKFIMPIIRLKGFFLVLTCGSNNFLDHQNVISLNYVSQSQLKYIYKNCVCLCAPIFEGYGTRIKILEALVYGANILTTRKGIEGINFPKESKKIIVTKKKNNIVRGIYNFAKNKNDKYYDKRLLISFSMEINALLLFNKVKILISNYNKF